MILGINFNKGQENKVDLTSITKGRSNFLAATRYSFVHLSSRCLFNRIDRPGTFYLPCGATTLATGHGKQRCRLWMRSHAYVSVSLFTVVSFITLFSRRTHQLCNWIKYPLSVKSFISLFSRLISVIKYNDVMVKYPLSDETIWFTICVSFRFIRGLTPCHRNDTTSFSSLINLMSCQ
jgi:hypothetical protein